MSVDSRLKTWCDSVDNAAIGKTQDTYDAIGTVTIKGGKVVKELLGFVVNVVNAKPTSGENGAPVLQVNSKDLNIVLEKFNLGNAVGDGIATNMKEAPTFQEFIPFKAQKLKAGSLDNAKIDFSLSGSVTSTEGWDVAVGAVFASGPPDMRYEMELLAQRPGRVIGGDVAFFRAGIKAATRTSFTDTLQITSVAKTLRGIGGYCNVNAPTAAKSCVGTVEFSASQITDFTPQIWPFMIGYGASLGTPVGGIVSAHTRSGVYNPTRFPLPETNFDMEIGMTLANALTNEADGIAHVSWS